MANPVPRDSVRQAAAAASAVLLSEAHARTRRVHGHCGRHASALTDPEVGTRLPGPLSAGAPVGQYKLSYQLDCDWSLTRVLRWCWECHWH